MTYIRHRAGQATADETMAAYLKALTIKQEILGSDHLSVGKTLNNIGSIFHLKKKFPKALKAYMNAYEIMLDTLGQDHLDVATVSSNIGDVHAAMGSQEKALEFYKKSLGIRWVKLGPSHPKVIRLMERTATIETGPQTLYEDDFSKDFDMEDTQKDDLTALNEEIFEDIRYFDLTEKVVNASVEKETAKFKRAKRRFENGASIRSFMFRSSYLFEASRNDVEPIEETSECDEMSVMSAPADMDESKNDEEEDVGEILSFLRDIGIKHPSRKSISIAHIKHKPTLS